MCSIRLLSGGWDSTQDTYSAARELMFATMLYRILPNVVNLTRSWARDKAAEHTTRADALRQILMALHMVHHDGAQGVVRLQARHELIAKRYASVARAKHAKQDYALAEKPENDSCPRCFQA